MNRVKKLRNEKKLTQDDLAKILSVKRPVISKYENCVIPLTDDTIKILASFFDVSSDYLLGLSETKKAVTQTRQPLTKVEVDLLDGFRMLNDKGQDQIMKTLVMALNTYKKHDFVPDLGTIKKLG